MPDNYVPSAIDFHDLAQARAWEAGMLRRRPWRPKFYRAFADALNTEFSKPVAILELGSGPSHLAEVILSSCNIQKYAALDFSEAMHTLARERLSAHLNKVEFVRRDFRRADWPSGLGSFDAIVTMQAAHEVRRVRDLHDFLLRARQCLKRNGLLLFCDHYVKPKGSNADSYLLREEQAPALKVAGYSEVSLLHDEGGMALYRAILSQTS